MVSPRTAQGAHTAVLDALGLIQAFAGPVGASDGANWSAVVQKALAAYEPLALDRARQLYELSLERSADVTFPGFKPRPMKY